MLKYANVQPLNFQTISGIIKFLGDLVLNIHLLYFSLFSQGLHFQVLENDLLIFTN